MIKIIEHNDYNKPVDNFTVIKRSTSNGYKKLFKVLDGIWLDPSPLIQKVISPNSPIFTPYQEDYCQTVAQKSKYLEQMTILFKRINSVPLGQGLLEDLSKGAPIDFSHKNIWNEGNAFLLHEKSGIDPKKLRVTCTISPNTQYLENQVIVNSKFGLHMINTNKSDVFFHPDCIYSIRKGCNIIYCDPVIPLTHELIHVLHNTYSVLGYTTLEEEYITFGALNASSYLDSETERYHNKIGVVLHNLDKIKRHISKINNIDDKKYVEEKYGFTIHNEISAKNAEHYIQRFQDTYSEYDFAKQFNLRKYIRDSYDDRLFIPFKFDISDPKVYTINQGLLKKNSSIKEISQNSSNILLNMGSAELHKLLKKYRKKMFIRSLDNNENDIRNKPHNSLKSLISDVDLENVLQNISTVQDKVSEVPQKIIGIYSQKVNINNTKEGMPFNTPPKHVKESEYIEKLITFKVADLVGFDRIKPEDMLVAHKIDSNLLYSDKPITFTSDNIEMAIEESNVSYICNESISKKMQLAEQGKAILKTGNNIVNIVQFGMWVDELVEDFSKDSYKTTSHVATDILSIMPYLGQMINIVSDIKDENYLFAAKSLGILVLLEVFPELLLPLFLIDIISARVMNNERQKEIISKFVWGILMEREQLLDNQLRTQSKDLANICMERISKITDHIEELLNFNVQAIIHNIKIYAYKKYTNQKDILIIDDIIFKARKALLSIIEEKRTKIINLLFESFKKTIVEDYTIKAKGEINEFNERTKLIITSLIKKNSNDIPTNRIEEALNIVEKYIRNYNINKIIKRELDTLSTVLNTDVELLINESTNPLVHTYICLNQNNKPVNNVNNKILNNYSINYKWGRKGNAMRFMGGDYLQIKAPEFSTLNALKDFTIEFWIQVPLTEQYDKETNEYISIIKNGSTNKKGWSFVLNNRYIIFDLYKKQGVALTVGNYLITNNKWTKISVVNRNSTKTLSFFINGEFFNELSTSRISSEDIDLNIDNVINIEIPQKKNLHFALDDFKVYDKALKYINIFQSYENDHNKKLLYDYFGSCIKKDRQYILANYNMYNQKYYPINQLKENDYWVYSDINSSSLQNYDFTIVFEKHTDNNKIQEPSMHPDIIYKNNNIIITSYDKSLIWGVPIDYEKWGIDAVSEKKYYLHINNNLRALPCNKIYGLEADIATRYDANCIFKIFNMFDYTAFSSLLNNEKAISLALYKDDILKGLLIHHNKEILVLYNALKNKNITDKNIIIDHPYYNIVNDLEDYLYKSVFYLFPKDELEYYTRLYK